MAHGRPKPVDGERAFSLDELFFSTTDERGVIRSGNAVFARVSGYPLAELCGRPHSLVRHPDMPRVVFKLLWDYLKAGKTIAAYVKNMAADGRHYWVIATAASIDGGYISVRFKPSSPIFPKIAAVYGELLEIEMRIEEKGRPIAEAMAASGKRLGEILASLGFESYDAFMNAFLPLEIKSRNDRLSTRGAPADAFRHADPELSLAGRRIDALAAALRGLFDGLGAFADLNQELCAKAEFLLGLATEISLVSTNALVSAKRIGDAGLALSVVADILGKSTETGAALVRVINEGIARIVDILRSLATDVAVSSLQIEAAEFFAREVAAGAESGVSAKAEDLANMSDLTECVEIGMRRLSKRLVELELALPRTSGDIEAFTEILRTLEMIHVTGKIEAERLAHAGAFRGLFDAVVERVTVAKSEMARCAAVIFDTRARLRAFDQRATLETAVALRQGAGRMAAELFAPAVECPESDSR